MQIKFHLTAALADYVASVLEQDAGGEINELGKLSETEYFSKTYVLPGGYQWETEPKLQDKEDVLIAAAQIETATDVDDETKQSELTALIDRAGAAGIDITVKELTAWLAEHEPEIPSYSWVQLNDFRLFELQDRCYPWLTTDELREQTDELPGPARPKWEQSATVAGQLQLTEAMIERCDQSFEYGNLYVHLLSLTDIFVFKSITEREGDLEDAALIARQADLDWESIFQEIATQEDRTGQLFSFAVLDTLDALDERHDIVAPITDRLLSYCLENALLVSLDTPKTIEDLREELDFPDHRIYNKLRKLEEEGQITVDRTSRLNTYQRAESTNR